MNTKEIINIVVAVIILGIIISLKSIIEGEFNFILWAMIYSFLIIFFSILGKMTIASLYESNIEHQIWSFSRWGFRKPQRFESEVPLGIIIPLLFSVFSLGAIKLMTLLSYETTIKKSRSARRFGIYSYTSMTDWHNALIGAGGIVAVLILSIISYSLPADFELLSKLSVFYALSNLIPLSKLDGNQIFFGSRILWLSLSIVTVIMTLVALTL